MGTRAVFEWEIENLDCWRLEVHGDVIESGFFSEAPFRGVELYPRGISGCDDNVSVQLYPIEDEFTGDLTYIGPDGSLIFRQEVKIVKDLWYEEGPEFEQVVKGDRLVLRFCFPSDRDALQRMCSTIGVSTVSVEIDPKSIGRDGMEYVSFFSYSEKKDEEGLALQTIPTDESVQLALDPLNKKENVWGESRVSLPKSDGSLMRRGEKKEHLFSEEEAWVFAELLDEDELFENCAKILVDVKIVSSIITKRYNHLLYNSKGVAIEPDSSNRISDSMTALKSDFTNLYQDKDYSDFRLKCDDVSFPVHRNILSARSTVFKSMLSSGMIEAASGCMDIQDLDPSTLGLFLAFLYTGAVVDLQWDSALKLYYAADKYQVISLKKECVDFLMAKISVSKVCELLTLADQHQDGKLFSAVQGFIRNHFDEVSSSEEWKKFVKKDSQLEEETSTSFSADVVKFDPE